MTDEAMLNPDIETQITWNFKGDNYRFSLHFYKDDLDSAILTSLEVNQDSRRCGIGTQIMDYVENFARHREFKRIFLKILNINRNTWLHQWYLKQGYVFHEEDTSGIWLRKDI